VWVGPRGASLVEKIPGGDSMQGKHRLVVKEIIEVLRWSRTDIDVTTATSCVGRPERCVLRADTGGGVRARKC